MQRIAIIHDWLTTFGGAEQVLLQLHELYPEAPIFLGFSWPESEKLIPNALFRYTYLQSLPRALRRQQLLIPLLPAAFESLNLKEFDIIISLGTGYSKGVITFPGQRHISYCHTPARYLWHLGGDRRNQNHFDFGLRAQAEHQLRLWDVVTAERVDTFLANSKTTQQRIQKIYRQDSQVLYPPVDTELFQPAKKPTADYYLCVGRQVVYKRIDLAIQACLLRGERLIVAGSGPENKKLKALAFGSTLITFIERPSRGDLAHLFANAKALIFPGEEDFGIVPLEAQSSGRPVIAFAKGGALETVIEGKTGTFFNEQTATCLAETLEHFDVEGFSPKHCRLQAKRFSAESFKEQIRSVVTV